MQVDRIVVVVTAVALVAAEAFAWTALAAAAIEEQTQVAMFSPDSIVERMTAYKFRLNRLEERSILDDMLDSTLWDIQVDMVVVHLLWMVVEEGMVVELVALGLELMGVLVEQEGVELGDQISLRTV